MVAPVTRTFEEYAAAREDLLARIARALESDPRFTAAWLAGSCGRRTNDDLSDIDLHLVVADSFTSHLCAHQGLLFDGSSAGTIPARLAVIAAFGALANIHENHHNAPPGGAFASVIYASPPLLVDWAFLPAQAARPEDSRLLFDRQEQSPASFSGSPVVISFNQKEDFLAPDPGGTDRLPARTAERTAFFWMVAAALVRSIHRKKLSKSNDLLSFLNTVAFELAGLHGRPWSTSAYQAAHPFEQMAALQAICDRVQALGVTAGPRQQVEELLALRPD